ncbi:amino acid ABC transporter ATP-binding protein [Granulicatella seriolae]|uniref:ATP-binding cassette domain-containing protein n=1 Tax=Granulicatella seriolae TaxID=2967226 RepID=A0ABT1WQ11_9LACT|nr:ATP-binding cassette domain-containing protein [Granulicatella seriolae]
MNQVLLQVTSISKSYDELLVIRDFSMTIKAGEIVALLGRSGTGKTTFMRLINNLEKTNQGSIQIGQTFLCKDGLYSDRKEQRLYQNKIGMVFQDYQLFPNLTILENLCEAPLAQKLDKKEVIVQKARQLLEKLGIADKEGVMPSTLSGGQRQRVAIARAMMLNPDILCFDEPTSALDLETTNEIGQLIKTLAKEGTGILIVTHDNPFAEKFSHRMVYSSDFV